MKRNGTLKIKNAAGCWEEVGFSGTLYRDGDYLFSPAFERGDHDEESWKCPEKEEGYTWIIAQPGRETAQINKKNQERKKYEQA